jgi:glycine dehydrogenase subunit 1
VIDIGSAPERHPLIPNAEPCVRAEMLEAIGVREIEELYAGVPKRLRVTGRLDLPGPVQSEHALLRLIGELLEGDQTCAQVLSFLGGGCWQHAVPALCDEIAGRAEFLTAYWANSYTDYGKYQAFFEFASLLGELLELDAVSLPTYDWGMAAGVAIRMAARTTGRRGVVLAGTIGPERRAVISTYCSPDLEMVHAPAHAATGAINVEELRAALSEHTAAVYLETPTYLGVIEPRGAEIAAAAHEHGAEVVAGVDPIALGVLASPAAWGADIVCGELQALGIGMHYGGGLAGFVASRDEERYVREYPTFLIGLTPTSVAGEHGFGLVAWERTSYMRREHGKDFAGTTTGLWAITAAVYLALLGPEGLRELGEGILQRAHYAASGLGAIDGVRAPALQGHFFKEFVVNFDGTPRTVAAVNAALLEEGIFGGHDLSRDFPELGQSALYCVTEIHSKADLDRMVAAVRRAVA